MVSKKKKKSNGVEKNDLYHLRKRLGLTQEQAAEHLGIHVRTYCRYERGEENARPHYLQFLLFELAKKGKKDPQ